jgi:hypothetical protein
MTKYISVSKSAVGFILLASAQLSPAADMYNITASAGLMLDDNITRAQYSRDIYDDRAWFAGLSADYSIPISNRSRAQLTANIESWEYNESNLDHNIFSLQADYVFQPAGGYTAPWYSISVTYGINANDSTYRNGNFNELGLTAGKRLTDATSLRTGINFLSHTADNDNFSTDTTRLYGNLDFKFGQHTAYTTLAYSTGDIVSTVGRQSYGDPYPPALDNLDHTDDDAFPWLQDPWAYKLDADTWSLRLGYVHSITHNQSIDASLLYYTSSAYGGNDYDGIITTLAYFYRF